MLQKGQSGDGCDLPSTLCRHDLRKGDLFVMSWAKVRRVTWGSISLELQMYGGCVHSILLLPLAARCLDTIGVCVVSVCCVNFASLYVFCNELYDYAWNVGM